MLRGSVYATLSFLPMSVCTNVGLGVTAECDPSASATEAGSTEEAACPANLLGSEFSEGEVLSLVGFRSVWFFTSSCMGWSWKPDWSNKGQTHKRDRHTYVGTEKLGLGGPCSDGAVPIAP